MKGFIARLNFVRMRNFFSIFIRGDERMKHIRVDLAGKNVKWKDEGFK